MYSDIVTDHFQNPRNVGEITDASGIGHESNPVCGDAMVLYLKIEDDHVVDAKFKTVGCPAAVAASSMTTVMVRGKSLEDAVKITNKDVAAALGGLPASKLHCSVLAQGAIRKAVADYRKRDGG